MQLGGGGLYSQKPLIKSVLRITPLFDIFRTLTVPIDTVIFGMKRVIMKNSIENGGCMKKAFTLAEVLITLGIIGIVAAMTLPTLIQNNRNKELQTSLKKAYSIMGQALDLYQAENGERIKPGSISGWGLKPVLMKYLKIAKDCGHGSMDDTACIKNYGLDHEDNSTTYTTFTGNRISLIPFDDGQFVLVDGSLVLLENSSAARLYISVDVNGYNKRPNQLGKDLFMFQIDNKGILRPMGVQGTDYYSETDEYCSKTSSHNLNGAGCTYKALTDNNFWKNLR